MVAERRWGAMLLALMVGCTSARVVRLDTGEGRPIEHVPPTSGRSVVVDDDVFKESLARLVLQMPMPLRSGEVGMAMRVASSWSLTDRVMQGALRKGYHRWCQAQEAPGDCLSLLQDGLGFSANARLGLGLALSFAPMHESIAEALEGTFSPTFFTGVVVASLVSWVVLAANPEPIFTKVAAVVAAVLLVYLGVDAFLEVAKACFELKHAADEATTFAELEKAGARFGRVVGIQGARVFVLAVAAVVGRGTIGGAAWMTSRLRMLPRFSEAARQGASQVGIRLEEAAQVSAVAVVEHGVSITLASNAVAMVVMGSGGIQGDPDGEVHHICTDKNSVSDAEGGPWTPLFEKIFSKAGMSLKNDLANQVRIRGHKGPHPEAYHREVHDRVRDATSTCSGIAQCRDALMAELRLLASELVTPRSPLRGLITDQ
ncbi:AHH domain-containing protein [Pyxidicoccus sp. 3LG]